MKQKKQRSLLKAYVIAVLVAAPFYGFLYLLVTRWLF